MDSIKFLLDILYFIGYLSVFLTTTAIVQCAKDRELQKKGLQPNEQRQQRPQRDASERKKTESSKGTPAKKGGKLKGSLRSLRSKLSAKSLLYGPKKDGDKQKSGKMPKEPTADEMRKKASDRGSVRTSRTSTTSKASKRDGAHDGSARRKSSQVERERQTSSRRRRDVAAAQREKDKEEKDQKSSSAKRRMPALNPVIIPANNKSRATSSTAQSKKSVKSHKSVTRPVSPRVDQEKSMTSSKRRKIAKMNALPHPGGTTSQRGSFKSTKNKDKNNNEKSKKTKTRDEGSNKSKKMKTKDEGSNRSKKMKTKDDGSNKSKKNKSMRKKTVDDGDKSEKKNKNLKTKPSSSSSRQRRVSWKAKLHEKPLPTPSSSYKSSKIASPDRSNRGNDLKK